MKKILIVAPFVMALFSGLASAESWKTSATCKDAKVNFTLYENGEAGYLRVSVKQSLFSHATAEGFATLDIFKCPEGAVCDGGSTTYSFANDSGSASLTISASAFSPELDATYKVSLSDGTVKSGKCQAKTY